MIEKPTYDELLHRVKELEKRIQKYQEFESDVQKIDQQFKTIFEQSFQFAFILDIDDGVAKSRHLPRYRDFPDARNTTCMTAHLKKHDALYMATSA